MHKTHAQTSHRRDGHRTHAHQRESGKERKVNTGGWGHLEPPLVPETSLYSPAHTLPLTFLGMGLFLVIGSL